MSDPTLDPETRALVDALLEAVDEAHITRAPLYEARDALRDHLKPKPLTVEDYAKRWWRSAGGTVLTSAQVLAFYRDLKSAIARGEVVDDE